jgi:hypothetical protein
LRWTITIVDHEHMDPRVRGKSASVGARGADDASDGEWNLRKTGLRIPRGADGVHVVLGDELRAALDSWRARRDAAWPQLPRAPEWRAATNRMSAQLHDAVAPVAPHLSEVESEELDELLRSYDLAPMRAYARSRAAAAPPDDGGLAIVAATYGSGVRIVDVTQVLTGLVVGGRLLVRAKNSLAGDPAVGVAKELAVTYVWRGQRLTRTVAEHETLELP